MPRSKNTEVAAIVKALKSANMAGRGAYSRPMAKSTSRPYKKRNPLAGAGVSGRGFYKGFGGDLGKFLGGAVGTATGIPGLSQLGEKLGRMGSRATGWGAYKVHHNSLIADIPVVNNPNREGATQVRHREYIGDVVNSAGFTVQYQLPINAGIPATFPWEAVVGSAYQQYQVNGMIFEFVSSSGDTTSGSTSLGTISMATQYDSILPPFTSKLQILNQEFSTSCKPSVNAIHPIECAPNQTSIPLLYTRTSAVPTGADQRLYDLGVFYLCTEGQQGHDATSVLGELWCTYDILLYKPTLSIEGVIPPVTGGLSHFTLLNASQNGYPFASATTPAVAVTNDLGLVVTNSSVTFPPNSVGGYQVQCYWRGAGTSSYFNFTSGSGVYNDAPLLWSANTSAVANLNSTDQIFVTTITIPEPSTVPVTMNFSGSAVPSGSQWTNGDLIVTQIPANAL